MKNTLLLVFTLMLLFSCRPQVPSEYIQPDELEDILFDYHIAENIAANATYKGGNSTAMTQIAYREAVLNKHGVTEAQFDSSLVYYTRHTEQLKKIYENLSKRLTAEAQALGSSVSGALGLGSLTAEDDTASIWKGDKSLVLSANPPFNESSFTIKADTSFHKGDRIILKFQSQFIYQDGMRDGVACLAVVFRNDSVASQCYHISSDSQQTLDITDDKQLGIKEIRGFFHLASEAGKMSTTLRLMCLTGIDLIRMHQAPKPQPVINTADSVSVKKDSNLTPQPVQPIRQLPSNIKSVRLASQKDKRR